MHQSTSELQGLYFTAVIVGRASTTKSMTLPEAIQRQQLVLQPKKYNVAHPASHRQNCKSAYISYISAHFPMLFTNVLTNDKKLVESPSRTQCTTYLSFSSLQHLFSLQFVPPVINWYLCLFSLYKCIFGFPPPPQFFCVGL